MDIRRWFVPFYVIVVSAPHVAAQTDWNVLPADSAPRKMLVKYLLAEAQKHFDAAFALSGKVMVNSCQWWLEKP